MVWKESEKKKKIDIFLKKERGLLLSVKKNSEPGKNGNGFHSNFRSNYNVVTITANTWTKKKQREKENTLVNYLGVDYKILSHVLKISDKNKRVFLIKNFFFFKEESKISYDLKSQKDENRAWNSTWEAALKIQ